MKTLLKSVISLFLALIILSQIVQVQVFAENQAESEVYIEEVRIFSKDYVEAAKKKGYVVLQSDLNADAAGDEVYLGYKVTTDPDKAIYDLKLMNMAGGYKFTNINEILIKQQDNLSFITQWFKVLVEAYRQSYRNGYDMAKNVYPVLNLIRVDEDDPGSGFGEYIINEEVTSQFVVELLLFCNKSYIDTIIKLLVMGLQDNYTWLEKLSENGPYDKNKDYTSMTSYASTSVELSAMAKNLLDILNQHAKIYNLMEKTGLFDEEEYDEEGNLIQNEYYTPTAEEAEILHHCSGLETYYETAFSELETYPYGEDSNLKEFFCSLENLSSARVNYLYPLIASLNPGQYAALYFGCVPELILSTIIVPDENVVSEDDFTADDFNEIYTTMIEEAKEEYDVEYVWLYDGVDEALLDDDTTIAFTEEAERHKAETGEMDYFENDLEREDEFSQNMRFTAFVGMGCIGILSVSKTTAGIIMTAKGANAVAAMAAAAGYKGTFGSILLNLSGTPGMLITLAIVAVVFIYSLCAYFVDYIDENYPDWDDYPIPDYVYDVTDTKNHVPVYNLYEAVKQDNTDEPADLNTFDGKQWLVLYASYDNVDGTRKPIKADSFKVQTGNGEAPEGYVPLCEFGEVLAKDLNAYERNINSKGLYLFYQQDEKAVVESTKTYYIKDIYMQTGHGDTECINKLKSAGYTPINYNLTPHYIEYGTIEGRPVYTYIGYKLTTSPTAAVRDIRVTYDYNAASYTHGTITYGEHGTSGKLTLYVSKVEAAGTPVLADGILIQEACEPVPEGYEPVNLFTGGPAVSFNHTVDYLPMFGFGDIHVYFLPEVTFTEGPDYLSGIAYYADPAYYYTDGVKPENLPLPLLVDVEKSLEFWFGSEVKSTDYTNSRDFMVDMLQKRFGYKYMYDLSEPGKNPEYFMVSTTKNPYRAIYDVVGTDTENPGTNILFNSTGYSTIPTYHTYNDADQLVSITVNNAFNKNDIEGRFMLSGNLAGNVYLDPEDRTEIGKVMSMQEPVLISDVYFVIGDEEVVIPEGYHSITDIYTSDDTVVDIKNGEEGTAVELYLNTNTATKKPYISTIYAVDYATLYRQYVKSAPEFKATMLTRANALAALASMGATSFCSEDVKMPRGNFGSNYPTLNGEKGIGNIINFGYASTDDENMALRDLTIVCEGISAGDPEKTIYKNGYKYTLLCEIGAMNFTGLDDNYTPRIYLYGSTDVRLGDPITEFFVDKEGFLDSYETISTINDKDIMSDIRDQLYEGATAHNKEFWYLCGAWLKLYTPYSDIFVHVRKGNHLPIEEKPFISEIFMENPKKIYSREDAPWLGDGEYYNMYENRAALMKRTNADGYYNINGWDFMLFKRTDKVENAITDVVFYPVKQDTLVVDNCVYKLAGPMSYISSQMIFLYYTTDPAAGDPISALALDRDLVCEDTDTMRYEYARIAGTNTIGKIYTFEDEKYANYLCVGRLQNIKDGVSNEIKIFDNPEGETRISFTGGEEGKYISGIFIMDKNTIRQEKLAAGISSDECKCSKITKEEVIERLKEMGATFVLNNCIQAGGDNQIYIGVTRTDSKLRALKDVVLYTELMGSAEPEERISLNRKTYYLVAETCKDGTKPDAINLIAGQDEQDSPGPSVYMYVSKTAGEYLYELSLDSNPIVNGRRTVLSQNKMECFEDLAEQAKAYSKRIEASPHFYDHDFGFLHYYYAIEEYLLEFNESVNDIYHPEEEDIKAWYLHTKNYETKTIEETYPYIGELFVGSGQSKREALAELLKFDVDGYIDIDANQDAGGDYVYIGYRRCKNTPAERAITDVVVCEGKNPAAIKDIKKADTSITATYNLVAKIDLNKDAGGDYLYLYATKDTKAGSPLVDIYISEGKGKTVDKTKDNLVYKTVLKGDSGTKIDLNDGAGGDYLYLIQVRSAEDSNYTGLIHTHVTYGILIMGVLAVAVAAVVYVKKKKENQQ